MSQFYTYDFVYDDIPSDAYDLKIISFEDGSPFDGVGSSNVNIITQSVLRKSKPYYLGRTQEPVLEFQLTFGSPNPISGMERDLISAWLFGRAGYKKLQILQDDLNGAYFNCFLTDPKPIYIGGINYAFTATATCDSPFAYGYPKIYTSGCYTGSDPETNNFTIYNNSSEDEYLYPTVEFKTKTTGSQIILTNITDDNRQFSFGLYSGSALSGEETILVNNDLQILESSTALRRLNTFNKNWFRLLPGANQVSLYGKIEWLRIVFNERKKIGG